MGPAPVRPGRADERLGSTTLRANVARVSAEALQQRLESQGFHLTPVPGLPSFFDVLHQPFPIGRTLEHWLGLFYLQQAATGAAALALGARPGERILDLCAAPGGKASHLAELLGESGVLVAGDANPGRIRALVGNLYRLGHAGVMAVAVDGRAFPGGALFDRALVDVPCSGEGNPRTRKGALSTRQKSEAYSGHIAGVQRALLRRAVELVRPGGTILYSTCTSAPEENERVVARALARWPVTLEAIELDVPHDPGMTRVEGDALSPALEHAWRIGPDHLGSGALFMARLRREEGGAPGTDNAHASWSGWAPVPPAMEDGGSPSDSGPRLEREARGQTLEHALGDLEERMGVSMEALRGAKWLARADSVWLHRCSEWPMPAWERDASSSDWRLLSVGIRAFRRERSGRLKATNDLLRRLDHHLTAGTVQLSREEMLRLLNGEDLSGGGTGSGYVALRLEDRVVGRGIVRAGRLRSEIPKDQAGQLADALELGAGSDSG